MIFDPPQTIELDPDGTYVQTVWKNVPVIRRRKPRPSRLFSVLYSGLWTPMFGYPSVVQSNRSFLAGCSWYWKHVLAAADRAAWAANPGPGGTGFQRYMLWQKANEGLKMVNPRIDLWDTIPPFPVAPGAYSPPTITVSDTHLWLTAPDPGNDASYLQGKVSTTPDVQYVQVSVKPFRRSISPPKSMNTNYHLVLPSDTTTFHWYVDPDAFGAGSQGFEWFSPFGETNQMTFTFQVDISDAHSLLTWPTTSAAEWSIACNPLTSPAGPAETVSTVVTMTFSLATISFLTFSQSLAMATGTVSGARWITSQGTYERPVGVARFVRGHIHGGTTTTDLWEFPFHTMGAPHSNFYTYVRLMPVDIATGSPGDPYFFLAAPE